MSLEIGSAVVGVQAASAPVGVGVVGVGGELEQDRRVLAGFGGADDEEQVDLGGPPVAADELARRYPRCAGGRCNIPISSRPAPRAMRDRPVAAVRRGVLGDRIRRAGQVGLAIDDLGLVAEPSDLHGVSSRPWSRCGSRRSPAR